MSVYLRNEFTRRWGGSVRLFKVLVVLFDHGAELSTKVMAVEPLTIVRQQLSSTACDVVFVPFDIVFAFSNKRVGLTNTLFSISFLLQTCERHVPLHSVNFSETAFPFEHEADGVCFTRWVVGHR